MNDVLEAGLNMYGLFVAYDYVIALQHYKRIIKNIEECDLRTEQKNRFLKRNINTFALLPFPLDIIYSIATKRKYNTIKNKYCVTCKDVIEVRDDNNLEKIVDLINPTTN